MRLLTSSWCSNDYAEHFGCVIKITPDKAQECVDKMLKAQLFLAEFSALPRFCTVTVFNTFPFYFLKHSVRQLDANEIDFNNELFYRLPDTLDIPTDYLIRSDCDQLVYHGNGELEFKMLGHYDSYRYESGQNITLEHLKEIAEGKCPFEELKLHEQA